MLKSSNCFNGCRSRALEAICLEKPQLPCQAETHAVLATEWKEQRVNKSIIWSDGLKTVGFPEQRLWLDVIYSVSSPSFVSSLIIFWKFVREGQRTGCDRLPRTCKQFGTPVCSETFDSWLRERRKKEKSLFLWSWQVLWSMPLYDLVVVCVELKAWVWSSWRKAAVWGPLLFSDRRRTLSLHFFSILHPSALSSVPLGAFFHHTELNIGPTVMSWQC